MRNLRSGVLAFLFFMLITGCDVLDIGTPFTANVELTVVAADTQKPLSHVQVEVVRRHYPSDLFSDESSQPRPPVSLATRLTDANGKVGVVDEGSEFMEHYEYLFRIDPCPRTDTCAYERVETPDYRASDVERTADLTRQRLEVVVELEPVMELEPYER